MMSRRGNLGNTNFIFNRCIAFFKTVVIRMAYYGRFLAEVTF